MNIVVNAKHLEVKDGITIKELLHQLQVEDKVMAVAVNMNIVKKEQWSEHKLQENDKVELLHFVGGG